jgi:hypothetical protein
VTNRFNTGEGQQETAIVTSTGEFVVAWDFAKVKKGLLDKYDIKKYEDRVVQDNFKFGDDKEIVSLFVSCILHPKLWCAQMKLTRLFADCGDGEQCCRCQQESFTTTHTRIPRFTQRFEESVEYC